MEENAEIDVPVIEEIKSDKKIADIRERSFNFAVRIIKFCKFLEKNSDVSKNVVNQLLDSGTSVGANLEEAQAAQSRPDFIHKNSISLKEARECNYWLKLILATENFEPSVQKGIENLINESSELTKIIGKIIVTAKK